MRSRLWTLVLIVSVLASVHGSAAVAQSADGGTRSFFAQGSGNRALAMGGAFVAVANDPSAALWNPGGLGLVPQRGFQASRTNLFGLDMTEDYAALVIPSWRWGAAALTFRRLAVGGIDGRDENNVSTDQDLSWGESEIGVGYGRHLAEGLSTGVVFKLRHQSLAGLSASGVGADLGFHARPGLLLGAKGDWAERLTMGLSLRNLVAPSLRLDQDAVSDPLTAQLGLAYAPGFQMGGSFLASVDLERSQDLDTRIHSGLEYRPHPLLALRGGFSDATPTVGAGLEWHGLALDYLYEDNALGAVNRVGFSLSFGATVDESRIAARQAEEESLQQQLADAMDIRQKQRIDELLSGVDREVREEHHDDALQLLALATALSPGNSKVAEMEALCWREKAAAQEATGAFTEAALAYGRALSSAPHDTTAARGVARCRAESDRLARRSEQIRQQFAQALDAFSAGDLKESRAGFAAILDLEPGDREAAVMLERTQAAIQHRVDDLARQAQRFSQGDLFAEASAAIVKIRALDSKAPAIPQLESSLARFMQSAEDQAPPTRSGTDATGIGSRNTSEARPALSSQQRREIEDLYKRGVEAMQNGRNQDAVRYWELVHSSDPGYERVKEYLKREYLMGGMDSFADGKLDVAVGYWEKALQLDPTDEKTRGYLARAQQQLSRTREILGGER